MALTSNSKRALTKAVEKAGGGRNLLRRQVRLTSAVFKDLVNYKLPPKRLLFMQHYLRNGYNARRAGMEAGYSSSGNDSYSWLKTEPYSTIISDYVTAESASLDVTPERITEELAKMAFVNLDDFIKIDENGDPTLDFSSTTRAKLAGVSEITVDQYMDGDREVKRVRFKLNDKRGALELLGKDKKMFANRTELTGPDGSALQPPALIIQAKIDIKN